MRECAENIGAEKIGELRKLESGANWREMDKLESCANGRVEQMAELRELKS